MRPMAEKSEPPQDYSGRKVQRWVWLFPIAALALVVTLYYLLRA
jgi:hypothetical protein